MMTSWYAQIREGKYDLQFETTSYELFKLVEKACQQAVDAHLLLSKENQNNE